MEEKFKVAGVGEVLWDVFPEGAKFGGAPANFACHCHSLGAEAYVVSCVGTDERGVKARDFLANHGVNVSCLVEDPELETGVVNVTLDDEGKPDYEIKTGVAWDHVPWTAEMAALAPQLDAVCFGSLGQRNPVSKKTIEVFLDSLRPDCLKVFDINLRQDFYSDKIICSSLESASALKLNDEELPVVAGIIGAEGGNEDILKVIIQKYDLKLAALTMGAEGALLMTPEETSFFQSPAIEVVNTVGAGDSFTAAMITGFLNSSQLAEINKNANELAAYVCTQHGAVPPLDPEMLKKFI